MNHMMLGFLVTGALTGLGSAVEDRGVRIGHASNETFGVGGVPINIAALEYQCEQPGFDHGLLDKEFHYAFEMASRAAENFNVDNRYVKAFWPNKPDKVWQAYTSKDVLGQGKHFFNCLAGAAQGRQLEGCGKNVYPITITCNEDKDCTDSDVENHETTAHTNFLTRTMNLCKAWLDQKDTSDIECHDGDSLKRYESKALTLVHELTHLAIIPFGPTKDIAAEINEGGQMVKVEAYGTGNCADLAAADWHGKPAENAAENADNYAFIAAGTYWLKLCIADTRNPKFRLPADPSIPWTPKAAIKEGL